MTVREIIKFSSVFLKSRENIPKRNNKNHIITQTALRFSHGDARACTHTAMRKIVEIKSCVTQCIVFNFKVWEEKTKV